MAKDLNALRNGPYQPRRWAQEWPPWAPYRSNQEAEEWFALEEALYRGAARVLTTNENARQSIVQDYGVAPERVVTVSWGAPLETLPKPEPPSSEPVVLFVGMMTAHPNVSVIIPTYNHAAYVGQAVDSVLTQTYRDFEVLVSEKCFFDGIEEVFGLESCTS